MLLEPYRPRVRMNADVPKDPSVLAARLAVMEARRSCVRGLVHDFNNVMVGLCSFSEGLLLDMEPDDPRYEDLDLIRESAFRAHGLLRSIGSVNRGDDLDSGPLNLALWLPTQEPLYAALVDKGARVTFNIDPGLPWLGVADLALRDLLLVVVCEAAVGLERQGQITLHCRPDAGQVAIDVDGGAQAWQRQEILDSASKLAERCGGSMRRSGTGITLLLPVSKTL